jgi:formyltetrahydrofolate synthetase
MTSKLDPTKLADWKIAEAAEENMKRIEVLAREMGVLDEELYPYGHYTGKLDFMKIQERLKDKPNGKFIDITAITPTPLGSGKSTTTIGLIQGIGKLGKKVTGAIRQPSMGPTFNIKGSAAGGGLSQVIPLTEFSLGLTGDFDAIAKAHNLGMVALTARMQHEFNYGDITLEKKKLKRLNIDPRNLPVKWVIDLSAQALREIIIGIGGKMDGFMAKSGFQISVSSEIMAILSVANDLKDFRERLSKMIWAYSKRKEPITAGDLEVDGAMAALLNKAIYPNLMQTIEGQPVLVHTGPFANIALGQSSIIADRLGLKLADYHITESGFGADIGFEKFWNLKSRFSGLQPDCAVLIVTLRDLKMHGGGPAVVPGRKLDPVYSQSNPDMVEKGIENMEAHIETIKMSGITPVVCLNHFYTDTDEEIAIIKNACDKLGVRMAVSKHWLSGGEGAIELAEAVIEACEEQSEFTYLYEDHEPLSQKIEKIATRIYGADGVAYSETAKAKLQKIEQDDLLKTYGCCMAKTQFSLSDDPALKGRPKGWTLNIRDILIYQGAGFVVPVSGDIKLLPGTASDPAFRRIDLDPETGNVTGLF